MSRRRSSRVIHTDVERRGEPISRSRWQAHRPPAFLTLDRHRTLQSPYRREEVRVRVDRYPFRERMERQQVGRFPLREVSRNEKRPSRFTLIRPLVLDGLKKSSLCKRRAVRREVLFSRFVAGRSGGSPGRLGRYNRTADSQYSCRR